MYNEQIEQLISAALADGVLTEKEKQILFKKAQSMGIDLDEFEMVLDARLVELAKAEKAKAEASAPKSNKLGDVKKCPACGAMVQSYQGVCPECGYAFENVEANSTSRKLAEKIDAIAREYDEKIAKVKDDDDKWQMEKNKYEALATAVKTIPIPTTKADLFEFITTSHASMMDVSNLIIISDAYLTKYREALIKAKALFSSDPMFSSIISSQGDVEKEYESTRKKHKKNPIKPSTKAFIIALAALAGFFIFVGIMVSLE